MVEDGRLRRLRCIIFIRYGESEGNVDLKKYCDIVDLRICLIEVGV